MLCVFLDSNVGIGIRSIIFSLRTRDILTGVEASAGTHFPIKKPAKASIPFQFWEIRFQQ
jgi:hypothetical protein